MMVEDEDNEGFDSKEVAREEVAAEEEEDE